MPRAVSGFVAIDVESTRCSNRRQDRLRCSQALNLVRSGAWPFVPRHMGSSLPACSAHYDEAPNLRDTRIALLMSFAEKNACRRKPLHQNRPEAYVPMGDQRFQQLMSEMGAAFAQADDGEDKRRQARERERRHEQWLAQREAAIEEIVASLRQHGLSADDLI